MIDPATLDAVTIIKDSDGRTAKSFVRDLTRDMSATELLKLVDFLSHTKYFSGLAARADIKHFMDLHHIPHD
jgi:hypothetical protein